MTSASVSLLSVPWDIRMLWGLLSVPARVYLVALLATVAFASMFCARTFWFLIQTSRKAGKFASVTYNRHLSPISFLRQFLFLIILIFGAVLANEVFGCLRAVRVSQMSLSEYRLGDALEVPTALAFTSACAFIYVHLLCWIAYARLRRGVHEFDTEHSRTTHL
jgi:hypothetical protein